MLSYAASVAASLTLGCSKKKDAPQITSPLGTIVTSAQGTDGGAFPRGAVRLVTMTFDSTPMGAPSAAVVVVPAWGAPNEKFPVVVALHGHGESLKPPAEGAMGWPRDYALTRAYGRLAAPPLTKDDYESFVSDTRLAEVNRDLAARPFRGVIVACPFMPDGDVHSTSPQTGPTTTSRAEFILKILLPKVRAETPARADAKSTGIDGVSFGGALALRIGLGNPDAFGAVGAFQPALAAEEAADYVQLAQNARAKNKTLALNLVTSDGDYFRTAVLATHESLRQNGVPCTLIEAEGPHDYAFNRGPGSLELLMFHDKALRETR